MKKTITGIVTLLLTVSMLFTAAACGGGDASGDNGDVTTIRVDLHGWTPTVSSTSTPGSTAYNSPKEIAREFEELYDNKVKIEWVRDKNLTASAEDVSQYFHWRSRTAPARPSRSHGGRRIRTGDGI